MDLYVIAFESFEYGKSPLFERLISCPLYPFGADARVGQGRRIA